MMNTSVKNDISFQAKVGKRLLRQVRKEFDNNEIKVEKFEKMFQDTFQRNVDENLVIDIDKNKNLVFSHLSIPNVKYASSKVRNGNQSIAKYVMNECSKTYGYGEYMLFKNIISKSHNKGKDIDEISKFEENLSNKNSKKSFLELIKVAKLIKKENPETKLTKDEFEIMSMKIVEEELKTLGTDLNNIMNNLSIISKDVGLSDNSSCSYVSFYNVK